MVDRSFRHGQKRLSIEGDLHIDSPEQKRRPHVVSHEKCQSDQSFLTKCLGNLSEGLGTELVFPHQLTSETYDQRVPFLQILRAFVVFHHLNSRGLQPHFPCYGFMHGPFKLTLHLPGNDQDCQFSDLRVQTALESQICIGLAQVLTGFRAVKIESSRTG